MQRTISVLRTASKVLLASLFLVLAWTIFSAASAQASGLLGSLGSNDASSAAEDGLVSSVTEPVSALTEQVSEAAAPSSDSDSLLSPVTELVSSEDSLVSPVTDLVTDVVLPVTTVTAPVTDLVTDIVRPVTGLVDNVAAPVVNVVEELPVVGSVIEPVVEVVTELPVVGGVTEPVTGLVPEPAPVVEPFPVVPELVAKSAISVPVALQTAVSVPAEEAPVEAAPTMPDIKPLAGPQPVISDPVISVASDPAPLPQEFPQTVEAAAPDAESAVWSVPGNQSPEPVASAVAGSGSAGPGSSLRTSADSGSGALGDIPQGFSSDWLNGLNALFNEAESIPRSLALDHGFSPD